MSGSPPAGLAGLRLAVGTLTIIPRPVSGPITPKVACWAMLLAPVAVLPLAGLAALTVWAGSAAGVPGLVVGAVVVAALGIGTRGMHLDGLADTVDGFAAGWNRERALEVMRKGDIGPLGACTLIVVLLAEAAAIGSLTGRPGGFAAVGWAVFASRWACAALTVTGLPAARPGGLGAAVADSVPGWLAAGAVALPVLAAAPLMLTGWSPVQLALAFAAVLAFVWWLRHRARRLLGGVTGDVIGAGIEGSWCALLIVLSAKGFA